MTTSLFDDIGDAADLFDADMVDPVVFERRSPLAHLISEVVQDEAPVLAEWVQKVLPGVQVHLGLLHAKGMSREELERNDFLGPHLKPEQREQALRTLEGMDVQSLAVHVLNAVMSAWTVMRLARLTEHEQRLVLAAITLHDLNKMLTRQVERNVRLEGEQAELYEQVFLAWGERLGLWDFVPREAWQDVAFLAANAEAVRGENRAARNYDRLRSDPADLERLAPFTRLADLVVSIAKHPDDLGNQRKVQNVSAELNRVLGGAFVLRHHRTTENRGLLTQVIHNAVRERAEAAGWVPWLFFPDGVTYLAPRGGTEPELRDLAGDVRARLVQSVGDKLGQLVTRANIGMKYTPEFVELLPPDQAGELVVHRVAGIISDKKTPVTAERKAKTQLRRDAGVSLDLDYAGGLEADRLAEGLFALSKLLFDFFGGDREVHGEALLRALKVADLAPAFRAIDFTGGVGYPWYYVAGHYLRRHPGLAPGEIEARTTQAYRAVLAELGEPPREVPFRFLERYVPEVLSLGAPAVDWAFGRELERYEKSKGRGGKRTCAICHSPYEVREEFSVYSNKKLLGGKVTSGRGLCEVCQAEELLRRFSLGRTMRDEGSTRFLHLYPTYFFTSVTARAMARVYRQAQQVTFGEVARDFHALGGQPEALALADVLMVEVPVNDRRRVEKVEYSDTDLHAYALLGLPYPDQKPTDTEAWMLPALLALIAPLAYGVKVVASASARPPYPSGADFPDPTDVVVLDGPHPSWLHAMGRGTFKLTDLGPAIRAAMAVYGLTADAYRDSRGYTIWNQLGRVSRDVGADPLAVFGLADRIASQWAKGKTTVTAIDGMTPFLAERLLRDYQAVTTYRQTVLHEQGADRMSMIETLVDKYARFYRASGRAAYARLRPLGLAADVVLDSPPELGPDDLQLQIEGRIGAMLDGVRDRVTQGFIPRGAFTDAERVPLVEDFARYFLTEVFQGYCGGERARLRVRLNLLKNGAEAVYVKKYSRQAAEASAAEGANSDV